MTVSKERIAEIRAAWAADRQTARQEFRRDWLMHLVQISGQVGLGVIFGLSTVIYALHRYS